MGDEETRSSASTPSAESSSDEPKGEHEELQIALDRWVKPLLEADGGGIFLVGVDGDTVTVRLEGACGGCPGAPQTRNEIILPVVREALGRPVKLKLERTPQIAKPASPA